MHRPVLLKEVVDNLELAPGEVFLDGTVGGAGHSALVAERFGESVSIIGLDRDPEAITRSEEVLRKAGANFTLRQSNFRHMDRVLEELGVNAVDAILLDLGVSSQQLDTSGRGFSFQRDEPLSMSMEGEPVEDTLTAETILNTFDEEALELIIRGFGEERYSRRIAKEIVRRREEKPFKTTFDLVKAVEACVPRSTREKKHPATRTFQALRIAVNAELASLEEGLEKAFSLLKPGGRMCCISFHSLEDRIVKNFFRDKVKEGKAELVHKKPLVPTDEESDENPRSRSAKLRVIKKL